QARAQPWPRRAASTYQAGHRTSPRVRDSGIGECYGEPIGGLRSPPRGSRATRLSCGDLLLSEARAIWFELARLQREFGADRSATGGTARSTRSHQAHEEEVSRTESCGVIGRGRAVHSWREAVDSMYRRPQVLLPGLESRYLALRSLDPTPGVGV